MAYSVRQERQGIATELRNNLDEAERLIIQLRRENVLAFLRLLDRTEECFGQLESGGVDLRPEQARWTSLHGKLRADAKRIMRVVDNAGGFRQMRSHSSETGLWWRLDEVVAADRRHLFLKLGTAFGVMVAVLALVWILFEFVIPVDDNTVIASEALSTVQQLMFESRWDEALATIQEAKLNLTEPDAEVLIWEAAVRDRLTQTKMADQILAEAMTLIGPDKEVEFWWTLGSAHIATGNLDESRRVADHMIRQYPLGAHGYFLLGNVEEQEGHIGAAIELFDKTFELAIENDTQLAIIARIRMGTLLQQPANRLPADQNPVFGEGTDQSE